MDAFVIQIGESGEKRCKHSETILQTEKKTDCQELRMAG